MSNSDKVLSAARAYRDAHARERAPGAIPTGETKQSEIELLALCREMVDTIDAEPSTPIPIQGQTAARRAWPDPDGYVKLCRKVFGEDGAPREVGPAVIAWKALPDYTRVMCARGYQWTAHRYNGNLMFTQAKQDGRPGKTLEQPWYPLIMAKLPVWPIVIEAAGD